MECNSPTDVWVCLKMAIHPQKRCLFMRRMISLANGVWLVKSRSLALESPLLSPKNGWAKTPKTNRFDDEIPSLPGESQGFSDFPTLRTVPRCCFTKLCKAWVNSKPRPEDGGCDLSM